jgi:hypothetical protein
MQTADRGDGHGGGDDDDGKITLPPTIAARASFAAGGQLRLAWQRLCAANARFNIHALGPGGDQWSSRCVLRSVRWARQS